MAASLIGGAFLSATLQVLIDRLASREILDFFKRKKLSHKVLNKLKVTLLSVSAVIDDADKKQIHNRTVKEWVNELKDAAYDADDTLDEISTKTKTSSGNKVSDFVSNSLNPYFKHLQNRVLEVLERLEFLAKQKDVLGLKESNPEMLSQLVTTTSLVEESEVFGRDEDKRIIMDLLFEDSEDKIGVIPIVGMAGVGKTTLAQVVYNDEIVEKNFDLKAWVHVSQDFNVFRVTKTILGGMGSSAYDTDDLNLLQLKLKEKLLRKKFLLVLDDVWDARYENWDILKKPFLHGAPETKIIVTTRHESVALMMGTIEAHFLKQLPDESCWLVFAKHALQNGGPNAFSVFQVIGREIAKKCRGLPLAAKALGGILRSKPVEDWDKILKSEMWDFSDDQLSIIPALRLSYYYLPSHLKRCFAYCSMFPKGYIYEKKQIILLWMAENFLDTSNQNKSLEEVGDEYFHELVSRSFFQQEAFQKSCFVMHDLMNDLAKIVSGEFCSRLEGSYSPSVMDKTRHMSFVRDLYPVSLSEALQKATHLRTFLSLNLLWPFVVSTAQKVPVDLLLMLKCLRALSLCDCYEITELPDEIGKLRHLRYLNVSRTSIKKLPKSISNLYNLQTLKVSNCASLRKLPKNLHCLVNLRYLDTRGTPLQEMPRKISNLSSLQMLSNFVVGKNNEATIKELKDLSNLRGSLSIHKLQHIAFAEDALKAKMEQKEFLEELKLNWDGIIGLNDPQHEISLLENLRPHANLKNLTLHCYRGTKFPMWLGHRSFYNLISISFNCCRYCNFLPPLGQLPSLKFLDIVQFDDLVSIGDEFYGSSTLNPFPSLEILKFIYLPSWKKWHNSVISGEQIGAFSYLRELHIEDCPVLKDALPNQLPSLTKLVIKECQKLASSLPKASAISELEIINCDSFLLEEVPRNLRSLKIKGSQILQCLFQVIKSTESCYQSLDISGCSLDIRFPSDKLSTTLRKLMVKSCPKLAFPFDQLHSAIEWLSISESCDSMISFPLYLFPNLSYFFIKGCKNLASFSVSEESLQYLTNLYSMSIIDCPAFASFPKGGSFAPNLTHLSISGCEILISLPDNMDILFPYLQTLILHNCPKLDSFPGGYLPSSLITLHVRNCDKLIAGRTDWNLASLKFLEEVHVGGDCEDVEIFPEVGLLPASVTELFIDGFLSLKAVNGKGLQHLSSLTVLSISFCPKLHSFPKEGLPDSLTFLSIWGCPLLHD